MLSNTAQTSISTGLPLGDAPSQRSVESVGTCPCCGAAMRLKKPLVNPESNTIVWRGTMAQLTSKQAEIAGLLAKRMPAIVSHDQLIAHLWGLSTNEPEDPIATLKVHLVKLRKMLPPGVTIRNHYAMGYGMEAV